MTDLYAVMGNPIAHSKSPQIHQAFAEQTQQNLSYRSILVPLDGFAAAVDKFRAAGGKGLNITVPFKQEAYQYADQLSNRARRAGAVNTLHFTPGRAFGDNTDGIGLLRDLTHNHQWSLQNLDILLLGAGGAARGVIQPLLQAQPKRLLIANRTAAKAQQLAQDFSDLGVIAGCSLDDLAGQRFDLIINATSAGLNAPLPDLPAGLLCDQGACYDMVYGDQATPFIRWARSQGAALALDGRGMLVEQAAESFLLWREVRPDTVAVLDKFPNA